MIGRAVIFGLALACTVLLWWLSVVNTNLRDARQDADAWKESAMKTRQALDELKAEQDRLSSALQERGQKLAQLERLREADRKTLREAMSDKDSSDWGSTLVPDRVSGAQIRQWPRCRSSSGRTSLLI